MEKGSPPVGMIKKFQNRSPCRKDCIDPSRTAVKPQCWEVWQQVVLPTPPLKKTDATPPKITLDDIQVCVVSAENPSGSLKEKEADPKGASGIDCVITIEEEIEVRGKTSPQSRIQLRDDTKIRTVPELQDKAPPTAVDGSRPKDFTKPDKDGGPSKVEKATQTEVIPMEKAKICEDYIQKAKGSKYTLRDNRQANVVSKKKPRDSEEGTIRLTEPGRTGEPEGTSCNNLTARDKGDEEQEDTGPLKENGIATESARQNFRWYCYPESEGPRKAYSHLLDLCRHWLKPERHSKEQMLELLVLEQFLAILPKEIQNWVWHQHPESCGQAVDLVENFLTGLSLLERHGKKDFPPTLQMSSSKWGKRRTVKSARIKFRTLQKMYLQKSQESWRFRMKRRRWQPANKRMWKMSSPLTQRLRDLPRIVMPLSRVRKQRPESSGQNPFGRKPLKAFHAQTVAKDS